MKNPQIQYTENGMFASKTVDGEIKEHFVGKYKGHGKKIRAAFNRATLNDSTNAIRLSASYYQNIQKKRENKK